MALASDVSERHLANLEYGAGNASIRVRVQVARALQCPLAELLGDVSTFSPESLLIRELLQGRDESELRRARLKLAKLFGAGGGVDAVGRHGRIALIGLRGAGQSTLGRRLAEGLGYPFVELSRQIEQRAGCSIRDPCAVRRPGLLALRAARAGGGDPGRSRGGDRHAGRVGVGCNQLRPAAASESRSAARPPRFPLFRFISGAPGRRPSMSSINCADEILNDVNLSEDRTLQRAGALAARRPAVVAGHGTGGFAR